MASHLLSSSSLFLTFRFEIFDKFNEVTHVCIDTEFIDWSQFLHVFPNSSRPLHETVTACVTGAFRETVSSRSLPTFGLTMCPTTCG